MTERDNLVKELDKLPIFRDTYKYKAIIDFILADRKRIVGVLVKAKESVFDKNELDAHHRYYELLKAIDETLKNAGVDQ